MISALDGPSADVDSRSHGDDFAPVFRAVTVNRERRGVRLEKIYWNTLKEISAAKRQTLGDIVGKSEADFPAGANITSVLRVHCMRWLRSRLEAAHDLTKVGVADSLIQVSPVPAFALAEDKRILYSNQPFLQFIQSKFPKAIGEASGQGPRLSLDVQIQELVRTLKENRNKPVSTGFVLGVNEQRVRGRLNVVLAPTSTQTVILGYVSSS
jgi:predicted DNA-binding ribbon-helix-helix protein